MSTPTILFIAFCLIWAAAGCIWLMSKMHPRVGKLRSEMATAAALEAFRAERRAEDYELEAKRQRLFAQAMRNRLDLLTTIDDNP
jgi:hypothetical protein